MQGWSIYWYFHMCNKDNLEQQTKKCIFIGYVEGVKEYKLWRLKPREDKHFLICLVRVEWLWCDKKNDKHKAQVEVINDEAPNNKDQPSTSHSRRQGCAHFDSNYCLTHK